MANHNNYRAQTSESLQDNVTLQSTKPYTANTGAIDQAIRSACAAVKIGASEIGFTRQVLSYFGKATTKCDIGQNKGASGLGENIDYDTGEKNILRNDIKYECVFKCSDIYLPLSFNYTLRAEKATAISQIVDGPEIVQQVFKRPKVIECSLHIERRKNLLDNRPTSQNMAFVGDSDPINMNDRMIYNVLDLGVVFERLYENQDVFRIEHQTLKTKFDVEYVYMEKYTLTTNEASTIVDINFTLRAIDMIENSIQFGSGTIDPTVSAGGGAR